MSYDHRGAFARLRKAVPVALIALGAVAATTVAGPAAAAANRNSCPLNPATAGVAG